MSTKENSSSEAQDLYEKFSNKVFWILCLMVVCIFAGAISSTILYFKVSNIAKENNRAIVHLCNTSDAISAALSNAATQIRLNLENGVYDNLLARGIITKENIDASIQTKKIYEQAVANLKSPNNPCDKVTD